MGGALAGVKLVCGVRRQDRMPRTVRGLQGKERASRGIAHIRECEGGQRGLPVTKTRKVCKRARKRIAASAETRA